MTLPRHDLSFQLLRHGLRFLVCLEQLLPLLQLSQGVALRALHLGARLPQ